MTFLFLLDFEGSVFAVSARLVESCSVLKVISSFESFLGLPARAEWRFLVLVKAKFLSKIQKRQFG